MLKFNLGKFNVPTEVKNELRGTVNAISGAQCMNYALFIVNAVIDAKSSIDSIQPTNYITASLPVMDSVSGTSGENYRVLNGIAEIATAISSMAVQIASVFGLQTVSFPELILAPGDKLIIDTDKMTVTLNWKNVIHLLSGDSDFFMLLQGNDIITYSDSVDNRNVDIKVEWKDRWL